MDLESCIAGIRKSTTCKLKKAAGLPKLPRSLRLPDDLRAFYEQAGGAILFEDAPCEIEVVPPKGFVQANPVILGEALEDNISNDWFIVGQSPPQYITIDLNEKRLGRCYDSFWDRHSVRNQCPIIARSFTELLDRLITSKGQKLFWLAKGFVSLGDAYGDVLE
jgi:antitoxin YokJ